MKLQRSVPLAPYTTFNIGGRARLFVEVRDDAELKEALAFAKKQQVPFHVLAGGSNTLFGDDIFNGLVIHLIGDDINIKGERVTVFAGAPLLRVIKEVAAHGLSGMEQLAGIPGTIGGAVRGNAGAFGLEMKDVVESVRVLNIKTGMVKTFNTTACKFAYRHSVFKESSHIVTEVVLRLRRGDKRAINKKIRDTIAARENKHIQDIKSAGSFFVNPLVSKKLQNLFKQNTGNISKEGRVPAGWLLERAGFRGTRVGDAQSSEYHANYFLNVGNATAHDVLALAREAKSRVQARDGVRLEEEVTTVRNIKDRP